MPKRIPVETIKVRRDGKPVIPTIGKPFDFTAEELDDINKVRPQAVRKLIMEEQPEDEQAKAAAKPAARKTAAQKSEGEDL